MIANYFISTEDAIVIVCKSLDQILSEPAEVDRGRLDATTEEDIRRHAIEDGEDPDAPLAQFHLVIRSRPSTSHSE